MRIPILFGLIVIALTLAVDAYILHAARRVRSNVPARLQLWSALALYLILLTGILLPTREGDHSLLLCKMWILFGYLTVFFGKIVFVIIDLIGHIPCLTGRRPLPGFGFAGGLLAVAVFCAMWWGALVNRFNVQTVSVDVDIADLPAAFDGYRIVQISDLHVGTYGSDTSFISQLVDHINDLHPDMIVFTGDIVNRTTDEIYPFVKPLSRLHAPDGVYSILGNHDYGDYYDWPDSAAREASLQELCRIERDMGWTLLLNEHCFIRHGGDSIAVIGVENVGDPPFAVYGDLSRSYPDIADSVTKILLSHNPAHWESEIAPDSANNIALTLSGHTHAMQIELFGYSPAAWRYRLWGGLYADNSGRRQLYVNIGVGTVGMPMRLGATPEVTVINLRRSN